VPPLPAVAQLPESDGDPVEEPEVVEPLCEVADDELELPEPVPIVPVVPVPVVSVAVPLLVPVPVPVPRSEPVPVPVVPVPVWPYESGDDPLGEFAS
jgi:hypothetical protein